ncbi:Acetylcholinesterase [Holothuria leucospilota]|uniref:Carboxylic ester hydrolase n=1 Tax=Holothuria leucospilota TaxID=206669 RepID=A0A9Q1BSE2_HOLLE|nr:Acetylcholinesterase [Holothuria leucospilota]
MSVSSDTERIMRIIAIGLLLMVMQTRAIFTTLVNTTKGQLIGHRMPFSSTFLSQEREVDVFRGIPFAKPPVGKRRFRPAEPVEPWEGVFNATQTPPSCPQVVESYFEGLVEGLTFSEDCLYLNIFVSSSRPANSSVMVFIHGGSLSWGSGSDFPYDASLLALLGDVIVVTINYRLNIFGFLSTGDDVMPPNIGLTDQQAALKWINENIAAFGGDPNMVTIFGQSAGSACVGYHLLSPESRRYFQRVIMQSGTPLDTWATTVPPEVALERAIAVADAGGCGDNLENSENILECLRQKSVDELLNLTLIAQTLFPVDANFILWPPVIDGIFFQNDVVSLISEGGFQDVEILLGTNDDEGRLFTYQLTGLPADEPFIDKNTFALLLTGTTDPFLADLLEVVYSNRIDSKGNFVDAFADALGEIGFTCSMIEFAKQVTIVGNKVYMYQLTQEPTRSLWNFSWADATHHEETQFVFGLPFRGHPFYVPSYEEIKLSFYVIRLWTNFAKSGDPNFPDRLPEQISEWPVFLPDSELYKELDINFSNKRGPRQQQCKFWTELLPRILLLKR